MTAAPAIRTGRLDVFLLGRRAGTLSLVLRRVDALAAKLRAAAPALSDEFARIRPSPVYDRICEIVESQLARFTDG